LAHQFRAFGMQGDEQLLAGGVDEIYIRKVYNGPASKRGGTGGAPAQLQFADPGTRQAPFQMEAKFAGGVV
jgi:hypothetical protein